MGHSRFLAAIMQPRQFYLSDFFWRGKKKGEEKKKVEGYIIAANDKHITFQNYKTLQQSDWDTCDKKHNESRYIKTYMFFSITFLYSCIFIKKIYTYIIMYIYIYIPIAHKNIED